MEYRALDQKIKQQVKGSRLKLTAMLFLCSVLALVLGLLPALLTLWIANDTLFLLIGILVIILMPAIQNTVYAVFLTHVRNEKFTKEDIVYSFRRTGYHVGIYLLLYFIQLGFGAVLSMLFGSIPSVLNIFSTILNVIMLCIGAFCAFAIFEGAKGMFAIISGSFRMTLKHWKNVMLFALPFLIWILLVQLGYNMVVSEMIGTGLASIESVIEVLADSPLLGKILFTMFGIYLIQYLGSAFFQVNMFTAYATMFDEDFLKEYPTIQQRTISGQEIDID